MKFSTIICSASLASMTLAKTVFVTRMHYVTVDPNGDVVGSYASIAQNEGASDKVVVVTLGGEADAKSDTYTPTTLLTVLASYSSITKSVADTSQTPDATSPASTEAAPASSAPSSDSDSGIYAEISSSGADQSFAKSILDAHNAKRALHLSGDLSWDTACYQYAQDYADQYTCGAPLKHSGGKFGENLASGFASGVSAFNAWYSEGSNYDYSVANVLDHFTQVIWKGTTKVGCAYKDCGSGKYVICSYDPAGNIIGYEAKNLFSN